MDEARVLNGGRWTVLNQLGVQVVAVLIAIVFAAAMTFIILYLLDRVVKIKSSEDDEMAGLDRSYHGERGYGMLNPS